MVLFLGGTSILEAGLKWLQKKHGSLRLRFSKVDGKWKQRYAELQEWETEELLKVKELGKYSSSQRDKWLEEEGDLIQRSLDIEQGPVFQSLLLLYEGGEQELLLVAHHLVVDVVSWKILMEDLERYCESRIKGGSIELGTEETSVDYGNWYECLTRYRERILESEIEYCQGVVNNDVKAIPRDGLVEESTYGQTRVEIFKLEKESTEKILREVPTAYNTRIHEILLTALLRSVGSWVGDGKLYIWHEGHGREELEEGLNANRTVGWFTSIYPIYLESSGIGIGEDIEEVKESLRKIPKHGIGYGIKVYKWNR